MNGSREPSPPFWAALGVAIVLATMSACAPSSAAIWPRGTSTSIALTLRESTYGVWRAAGFDKLIAEELRKYDVTVEDVAHEVPSTAVIVTIGARSDRAGATRSIHIDLYNGRELTGVGDVTLPPAQGRYDFTTTVYASAPEVARLIAQAL